MMKSVPFTRSQIELLIKDHPTPFYIYDEIGIRKQTQRLIAAFAWNSGFKEYFAVKALPNPAILQILKDEGCGADCSSAPELMLAARAGVRGEDIMFTSNDTPEEEFIEARRLGAIINLDDIGHVDFLEKNAGMPELISLRLNPGPGRSGNAIIGDPEQSKFGMTRAQILEGYSRLKAKGVKRFGLHAMVVSSELGADYFIETARLLFELVREVHERVGIDIEFANLGGGLGIPYTPAQSALDLTAASEGIRKTYDECFGSGKLHRLKLFMECGRYVTGPFGYFVARVRHVKHTYKTYVGLDACMANLMRPGMYGAYHHITVLGKEHQPPSIKSDVVGSLCENNDKFAIDRALPAITPGDFVVIHDVGAYGHAMGFNFNGKLRSAEFLLHPDSSFTMIRRAETLEDHFATLKF